MINKLFRYFSARSRRRKMRFLEAAFPVEPECCALDIGGELADGGSQLLEAHPRKSNVTVVKIDPQGPRRIRQVYPEVHAIQGNTKRLAFPGEAPQGCIRSQRSSIRIVMTGDRVRCPSSRGASCATWSFRASLRRLPRQGPRRKRLRVLGAEALSCFGACGQTTRNGLPRAARGHSKGGPSGAVEGMPPCSTLVAAELEAERRLPTRNP